MEPTSDRRPFAFCLVSAVVGVPVAVWRFPDAGITTLLVPILVFAVLPLVDGYLTAS